MYVRFVDPSVLVAGTFGNISFDKTLHLVNDVEVASLSPNKLGECDEGNVKGV